ncbi:MAG: hypothetical protein QXU40_00970 [Candidatus Pacearchaeota archaeon]
MREEKFFSYIIIIYFFITLILISPFILSVNVENQTRAFSSLSGSTIRFEQNTTLDLLNVTSQFTQIYNLSTDGAKFTSINESYPGKIGFYGLTDSLIYLSNFTAICININFCDENINITLPVGYSAYVLDKFNLTEGINRTNTPLYISYISVSKRNISSNILDTLFNLTVILNSSISPSSLTYISASGQYNKTYNSSEYSFNSTTGELILNISGIENSSNNQIILDTHPPKIEFVPPTPDNGTIQSASYIEANVSVTDDNSFSVYIYLYNSSFALIRQNSSSDSPFFWNITGLSAGTYYLNATANDSSGNTNSTETRLIIINRRPSKVNLYSPSNGEHITNRTPTFFWYNATDPDGDTLTYQIMVDDFANFSSPYPNKGLNKTGVQEGSNLTNYTTQQNEVFDIIYTPYFWRVRAYDGIEYGEWSDVWNFTIDSTLIILVNDTVNFGIMGLGETNDTTDNSPYPFLIENAGNVFVNVSVYANNSLWVRESNPTNKFQFKADKNPSKPGSFNWALSITTWTNMSLLTPLRAIAYLDYNDTRDWAELDIKITSPLDEPPGTKSSMIIFESEQA